MASGLFAAASSIDRSLRAYDVFNGDADGLCALHQLRLAQPKEAVLITGAKREVDLLRRIACDEAVDATVLDVSLDTNHAELQRILEAGGCVTYFDHHSATKAFTHERLQLFIDQSPLVCTSILVDRHVQGRFRKWAVAAAFGDNLPKAALALAQTISLDVDHISALHQLGLLLNYNAYGERIADLHIAPDALYRALHEFVDPFDYIASSAQYQLLHDGYHLDAERMDALTPEWESACGTIFVLPLDPWARRISGVFANRQIAADAHVACAVLTEKSDGSFLVSVRSADPLARAANTLCERFFSGGGRRAAAGINDLPAHDIDKFVTSFFAYFETTGPSALDEGNHGS
jgi:hypothetical protein